MSRCRRDGLVDAIADAITAALVAHGVDPPAAWWTAAGACIALCRDYGGAEHWLPAKYRPALEAALIDCLAGGGTLPEAAAAAGVHPSTARRILRRRLRR